MNIIANAFPLAGVWVLTFMTIALIVLLPIFPLILRHRRRMGQRELHDRIEKARAKILEDGKVEGPTGPYVPHERWNVGLPKRTQRDGARKAPTYHGGPWPD